MTALHFATGNPHKVTEVREALEGTGIEVEQVRVDIHEIDAPDTTTVARRKVQDSFETAPVDTTLLVDDTGLYIDALDGFPGSHASFFLERCGNQGILRLLDGHDDRTARFKTSMAIYRPEEDDVTVMDGTCEGRIAREPRGEAGFGYDPIFIPEGHDRTFAEDQEYKMQVSHRTAVIEKLVDWLEANGITA